MKTKNILVSENIISHYLAGFLLKAERLKLDMKKKKMKN
jgi:hypothetical protein